MASGVSGPIAQSSSRKGVRRRTARFKLSAQVLLSQLVANLVEPRVRTAIVELGARRAARTDGADDLVAKLNHHATTEEHDVRQLGEWRNRILALGTLGQSECIVLNETAVYALSCALSSV
jgi:hypothetical protein